MRGRKPKPTALHKLHGNPSKLPRRAEPVPAGKLSDPPAWFDADQRESWHFALQNAPPGLLRRLDRGMLAVWCAAECTHAKAAQALARDGLLTPAAEGGLRTSAYFAIMVRTGALMIRAAAELGFGPVARSRVYAAASTPASPTLSAAPEKAATGKSLQEFLSARPPVPGPRKPAVH